MSAELEHGEAIVVMRSPVDRIVRLRMTAARDNVAHGAALHAVRTWMEALTGSAYASVKTYVRTMDGWFGPLQIHARRIVKVEISTTGRGLDERQADELEAEIAGSKT